MKKFRPLSKIYENMVHDQRIDLYETAKYELLDEIAEIDPEYGDINAIVELFNRLTEEVKQFNASTNEQNEEVNPEE